MSSQRVAAVLVALAISASSIVFSEPALADVLMLGVIVGVPLLGVGRFGRMSLANLCLWLSIVGLGVYGTSFSVNTYDTAIKHQIVTLYLAGGAVALAAYIAADAADRFRLVMVCYVLASLLATVAAFVGYFQVLPGAYDLFTNFGRARGTFKDPNVYGAAIAAAIVACAWVILREHETRARFAMLFAIPLVLGMLICFSRGAWISVVISLALVGCIALTTSRRSSDFQRIFKFVGLGTGVILIALVVVLQIEQVRVLLEERASLDQSYDNGPEGRFGGQAKARRLIVENPLGIGTHTFRTEYHKEEPHNVYLTMFLNAGWLGGLLYIVSVLATLAVGLRGAWRRGALQGPFLISVAAFAGVAIEGCVIDSDHWRSFFILMACVWGLADARAPEIDRTRRTDDVST